jgi:hypothetical protein
MMKHVVLKMLSGGASTTPDKVPLGRIDGGSAGKHNKNLNSTKNVYNNVFVLLISKYI